MRILLWHGYLLGGTGSNVYTRSLAREWSRAGHEVVVFSQDRHAEEYDLGGARHVRPEIRPILPVFVLDRYEGVEARLLPELTHEERECFVEVALEYGDLGKRRKRVCDSLRVPFALSDSERLVRELPRPLQVAQPQVDVCQIVQRRSSPRVKP